jgi:hypothetical protein
MQTGALAHTIVDRHSRIVADLTCRYNQSLAEGYFSDLPERVWTGLVNNIADYENPSSGQLHSPVEMQVAALFRGKGVVAAAAIARAVEQRESREEIARLEAELGRARRDLNLSNYM